MLTNKNHYYKTNCTIILKLIKPLERHARGEIERLLPYLE
jgi:hypothetical protein